MSARFDAELWHGEQRPSTRQSKKTWQQHGRGAAHLVLGWLGLAFLGPTSRLGLAAEEVRGRAGCCANREGVGTGGVGGQLACGLGNMQTAPGCRLQRHCLAAARCSEMLTAAVLSCSPAAHARRCCPAATGSCGTKRSGRLICIWPGSAAGGKVCREGLGGQWLSWTAARLCGPCTAFSSLGMVWAGLWGAHSTWKQAKVAARCAE